MDNDKWDKRFLELAAFVSYWSRDCSTKVGAVVVGPDREVRSLGYNGFPRGVNDDIEERHERPAKYWFTEHAERNAIYNAGQFGASLKGCTLYCTHPPCVDCARGIIQSRITRVIVPQPPDEMVDRWGDNLRCAATLLVEGGCWFQQGTTIWWKRPHERKWLIP